MHPIRTLTMRNELPGGLRKLSCMTAMLTAINASADTFDWVAAEDGVPFGQSIAFAGCAPATSIEDTTAWKIALLRAQARRARQGEIAVSGEEHIEQIAGGESRYRVEIMETASSFLPPPTVVRQEIAIIGQVSELCLLVVEQPPNAEER